MIGESNSAGDFIPTTLTLFLQGLGLSSFFFSGGHEKDKGNRKQKPQTERDESDSKTMGRSRTQMKNNRD